MSLDTFNLKKIHLTTFETLYKMVHYKSVLVTELPSHKVILQFNLVITYLITMQFSIQHGHVMAPKMIIFLCACWKYLIGTWFCL